MVQFPYSNQYRMLRRGYYLRAYRPRGGRQKEKAAPPLVGCCFATTPYHQGRCFFFFPSPIFWDCLLYVELNPVRAGIAVRPEDHEGTSLHMRELGKDKWMMPLQELLGRKRRADALVEYRGMLYYRGAVPTKPGQAAISARVLREEEARGFKAEGVYRKRLRYFVDGIAIGSEAFVRREIERLREQGRYLRRKHPISQLDGIHTSFREQRGEAIAF